MAPRKHVVFDVVGTCVSYQAFFDCLEQTIGAKLKDEGLKPQLFAFAWMEAAEREFAYLSISERYTTFMDIFGALFVYVLPFPSYQTDADITAGRRPLSLSLSISLRTQVHRNLYRMLWMAGIAEPHSFATDDDRDAILASYGRLETRPGIGDAMQKLRQAGFTVWCFTTGDTARVRGYFLRSGIDMPEENFVSCDTAGVAKPALAAYRSVLAKFDKNDEKWFAAAHMWDVSAAKKAGFKGAYCTVYEKEPCLEVFGGEMDVIADSLLTMADLVIAASP
ncbi:hypothetical protein LTR36_002239 [Oleoguttula mirabilis]|uniref:2-haloalkanoic acid dehalogenase n=1 Tax=Oleoguttula mirabilis TaxID=1507867 RepID=A0AAV9JKS2_9PEZI|nr:hypothetical protein LTR36_002239 [Oleoguttula mirabilis]